MSKVTSLLDKFRGAMIGGVIGDCLGSPVECQFWEGIQIKQCLNHFRRYQEDSPNEVQYEYTDDTAMARQVADSIITMRAVDSKDLAQRFVKEYYKEPRRGYGAGVVDVFRKLKNNDCAEPFKPASEQFNGSGSYGNGAAMRVHPVGLFCYENSNQSIIEKVTNSAKVTHTHIDAVNGAIIQAACVSWALQGSTPSEMIKQVKKLYESLDKSSSADDLSYAEKFAFIEECLSQKMFEANVLIEKLGNDVSALNSVPASFFSFAASAQTEYVPLGCESIENPFERSMLLAMSFGGDSDTIMSMTGAIAGAYFGESNIPEYMKNICEGVDNARRQADQLHKLMTQ